MWKVPEDGAGSRDLPHQVVAQIVVIQPHMHMHPADQHPPGHTGQIPLKRVR